MIFLGIDYGTKRIGIAISDESGRVALPLAVINHASHSKKDPVEDILAIVVERSVGTIILGESKDFSGGDNAIMSEIREFKTEIERRLRAVPVIYEPEFLTSHQAEHFQGKHPKLDASAAALILQSYLDRRNS